MSRTGLPHWSPPLRRCLPLASRPIAAKLALPTMSLAAPQPTTTSQPTRTVALIGNPNTGKSTLFNALAGMKARVGNYPGVTVEKKVGRFQHDGRSVTLIDLPGTYSLSPRTADEMVSVDVLLGRQADVPNIDVIVCILDASNLERNLYLFTQIRDLNRPTILVLNMTDVAESRGIAINETLLSERLGVPVVAIQAHRRKGIAELREAIAQAAENDPPGQISILPEAVEAEARQLGQWLEEQTGQAIPPYLQQRLLLDVGGRLETLFQKKVGSTLSARLQEVRERLGKSGHPIPATEPASRYRWIRDQIEGVITRTEVDTQTTSDRIDRVVTNRWLGPLLFAAIMALIFIAIYFFAAPLMSGVESIQGAVSDWVSGMLAPGPLRSLLVDGIIAGVGGVLIFLPQIAFLFLFIAILEDCGYMARAAFVMDRLMTRLGLSGKSFVPLMSSFACAIPGIMATRVIENTRDRMVTILIAPLMSCSARLPVYTLLIALFIPATQPVKQGMMLFAMYCVGILVAIPVAWILKRTWFPGSTPPFVMELPSYKFPSLRNVLYRVIDRSQAFITRAGTLIFATSILVWAAGYYPGDRAPLHALESRIETLGEQPPDAQELELLQQQYNLLSSQLMEESLLGRAGHAVEPVVKPLGWDWRIGVGVLASFPAREVIIATLGTIYSLGADVDETNDSLKNRLAESRWPDGEPVYTAPVALGIMVFFALCAQCAATLMIIRRETNSWFWPAFTFVYMTGLAYLGAFITYQVGTHFFS